MIRVKTMLRGDGIKMSWEDIIKSNSFFKGQVLEFLKTNKPKDAFEKSVFELIRLLANEQEITNDELVGSVLGLMTLLDDKHFDYAKEMQEELQ
jgi:hypothetical protein